jgi:hypothetical protein
MFYDLTILVIADNFHDIIHDVSHDFVADVTAEVIKYCMTFVVRYTTYIALRQSGKTSMAPYFEASSMHA